MHEFGHRGSFRKQALPAHGIAVYDGWTFRQPHSTLDGLFTYHDPAVEAVRQVLAAISCLEIGMPSYLRGRRFG